MLGPCWRRAGQEGALALYFVFPTPLSFFFKLSTSKHCRPSKDCKPDDMLKGYWRQATEDQPRILCTRATAEEYIPPCLSVAMRGSDRTSLRYLYM